MDDSLSDLRPDQRAEIAAMLAGRPGQHDEDDWIDEPAVGPIRRVFRWLLRLKALAIAGAVGWHAYALWRLPDVPFDAVHAPLGFTVAFGFGAILFLLWFDWCWRRIPLLLIAVALLGMTGLSMRWVDTSRGAVREHVAGWQRSAVRVSGDLCYRIDRANFALRGGRSTFVYQRFYWPTAFDEAAFKRYFFSDLKMTAGADGWTCRQRV